MNDRASHLCATCGEALVDAGLERCCPRCGSTEVKPRAAAARRRRRIVGTLIALLVLGVLVGAFGLQLALRPPEEGQVSGSAYLALGGARQDFAVRECLPTTRLAAPRFHGVGLLGPAPLRHLLIVGRAIELSGPLRLPVPAQPYLELWQRAASGAWAKTRLERGDCGRFEVQVESKRRGKHARFSDYAGSVDVACRKGQLALEARLAFEHCNGDPDRGVRALD